MQENLEKFVTFGQCRHIHRKKINDPPGFIVLQAQLAFTISSQNNQANNMLVSTRTKDVELIN